MSKPMCMICGSETVYYFSKNFSGVYSLEEVDYWQCSQCKFVYSKTHFDMSSESWVGLNLAYHSHYQGSETNADDPNWKARQERQRDAICFLHTAGHLPSKRPWLDWGAGDGGLTRLLKERDLELLLYDKYLQGKGYLFEKELERSGFDFVVSTSVFEHVGILELWIKLTVWWHLMVSSVFIRSSVKLCQTTQIGSIFRQSISPFLPTKVCRSFLRDGTSARHCIMFPVGSGFSFRTGR